VSQLAHDNAMKRVIQAGAKPVTAQSVMLEWQRDWAETATYDAVMDIGRRIVERTESAWSMRTQ
jgi:nicotinamidase-related amidase